MYTYIISYNDRVFEVTSNSFNYATVSLISHINKYVTKQQLSILEKRASPSTEHSVREIFDYTIQPNINLK